MHAGPSSIRVHSMIAVAALETVMSLASPPSISSTLPLSARHIKTLPRAVNQEPGRVKLKVARSHPSDSEQLS
jgi:hypothetical protein